jgi:hypothetical protein
MLLRAGGFVPENQLLRLPVHGNQARVPDFRVVYELQLRRGQIAKHVLGILWNCGTGALERS